MPVQSPQRRKVALLQSLVFLGVLLLQRQLCAGANETTEAGETQEEQPRPTQALKKLEELPDVIVVSLVDGSLLGLDRTTGSTLWKRDPQPYIPQVQPMRGHLTSRASSPSLDSPLVSTTTTKNDNDSWRTLAVPSLDGNVYLTSNHETVAASVKDLVARAPFVDQRGRMYTGTRVASTVAVDLRTGNVRKAVEEQEHADVLWLGRVDHTISIHNPRSGDLDVQFSTAELVSVQDMVATGSRDDFLLPPRQTQQTHVLVATPSGTLAYRDPQSNQVAWMRTLESPAVYALDASSSLGVTFVADSDSIQDLERSLTRALADDRGQDERMVVGSLPTSGELFAVTLGNVGPRQSLQSPHRHSGSPSVHKALPQIGASHKSESLLQGPGPRQRKCHAGTPNFHECLLQSPVDLSKLQSSMEFSRSPGGWLLSEPAPDQVAVYQSPFIPPVHHPPRGSSYRRPLWIVASWLPPTIALIFVVSFELGRRKKAKDSKKRAMDPEDTNLGVVERSSKDDGGVIEVLDDVILGYGGHGTVVYKGVLDRRQVAVKRMLKAYHASADREISLLIESDGHPNVVRYFLKEVRGDFVYLALELCDLSLHELICSLRSYKEAQLREELPEMNSWSSTKAILSQVAHGVKHIHGLRIVHRDLKPANILLADSRKSKRRSEEESVIEIFGHGDYVAKISDMGLSKQLVGHSSYGASTIGESLLAQSNGGQSSIAGAGPGSVGWQAPEVMALRLASDQSVRSENSAGAGAIATETTPDMSPLDIVAGTRTSRSADIFSLGCIFYSTLIPGSHPFGAWYERESNIMHNRPQIDELKSLSPDAYDLVLRMISRNPTSRPTARQVCEHPFFWQPDRRLSFLCDFSDRLEVDSVSDDGRTLPEIVLSVERNASEIVGTSWESQLHGDLVSNVQRFRTYDSSSVKDLLRLIRNKHHHFDELPENLRREMATNTAGLLRYFEGRYPQLVIHCYSACRQHLKMDDPLVAKYCIPSTSELRTHRKVGSVPETALSSDDLLCASDDDGEDLMNGMDTAANVSLSPRSCTPVMEDNDPVVAPTDGDVGVDKAAALTSAAPTLENTMTGIPESDTVRKGDGLVVWECSAAAKSFCNRGWSRSDDEWTRRTELRRKESQLSRCNEDPKFRTRLCNHWDASLGTYCPMRKKGKCIFAHGPVELRVKEAKKNRWGKLVDENGDNNNPKHSGGEDTYGAARSIEAERKQAGKWNTSKSTNKGNRKGTGNRPRGPVPVA